MLLIKHIDRYILRNFLKTFAVTFFGSIFVLLIQFMFMHISDLVGKGVGVDVLIKLFFYTALTLVPLSLPLSILLGSLMTFGNLGERFELTAMKAAGISLFRIMASLIVLIIFAAIGSFYFADNVLPKTQVQMWTLLFSIREKSPELEIPEGTFYNGIPGRNIYVEKKDGANLLGLVIYDYSNGFENTSIIVADSGLMEMSGDKSYLLLTLKNGETFETMRGAGEGVSGGTTSSPYRRETFAHKKLIIDFDANFKQMSSEFLQGQSVSKNTLALQHTIDSLRYCVDSLNTKFTAKCMIDTYFDTGDSTKNALTITPGTSEDMMEKTSDIKQKFSSLAEDQRIRVIDNAISRANAVYSGIKFDEATIEWQTSEMRKHQIEWHKRFTLSFACVIFLFIGAPLGAIIRKGGMGMPIVISTVLFICYYIIDNTGYKMAREGIWPVPYGMWLSAFVLLPLGIFLTYMAANDSTIMSGETYILAVKRIFKRIKSFFIKGKTNEQVEASAGL